MQIVKRLAAVIGIGAASLYMLFGNLPVRIVGNDVLKAHAPAEQVHDVVHGNTGSSQTGSPVIASRGNLNVLRS